MLPEPNLASAWYRVSSLTACDERHAISERNTICYNETSFHNVKPAVISLEFLAC